MKNAFVPYGIYEDIINILGQWKIVDMKSLTRMCNYEIQYFNLLKKVRKLENYGLVKGVLLGRRNKYIYLTTKGLQFTQHDHTYEICDDNLTHDLIVGTSLRALMSSPYFIDGKMFHQVQSQNLLPDAEVVGIKNGQTYNLALEIELTQKSQKRVKEKYIRYGRESAFSYALFITNKESLFKTYKRYLEEMNGETQEAVLLLLDKKLSVTSFNYEGAECFYLGKSVSFQDIFGDKNELNKS